MGHTFLRRPPHSHIFTDVLTKKIQIYDESDYLFGLHLRHTNGGEPFRHHPENQGGRRTGFSHHRLPFHGKPHAERGLALLRPGLPVYRRQATPAYRLPHGPFYGRLRPSAVRENGGAARAGRERSTYAVSLHHHLGQRAAHSLPL